MTIKDVLIDARAVIADPARWTTEYYARDAEGYAVAVCRGVAWCASGAIEAVGAASVDYRVDAQRALNETAHRMYGMGILGVNDDLGHAQVLAVYDAAIRSCE